MMEFTAMALKHIAIPVLLVLAQSFTACAGKSRKKAPVTQYFIHGNPLSLVENTETSPSFFTPANLAQFDDFHFSGGSSFIEREPVAAPTTFEEVEKENATDTDGSIEDEFEIARYRFFQESATRYIYAPTSGKGYKLGFELRDGLLVMVDIDGYPVTSRHYSLKTGGKAFSLLVAYEDPSVGRLLTAFYFNASDISNPIEKASKDFAFLFDTVKIFWEEPIEVQACGNITDLNQQSIKASLDSWLADTNQSATTRKVTYSVRKTHAPFSDLNQHCIFLIKDFKLENSTDFYTAGVTIPVINLATKRIVDADIMLFMDHIQVSSQVAKGAKSGVMMHELGHFWGLGHEFKVNAQKEALHPSIMGYSRGSSAITEWDYEAIRDLYGESLLIAP